MIMQTKMYALIGRNGEGGSHPTRTNAGKYAGQCSTVEIAEAENRFYKEGL